VAFLFSALLVSRREHRLRSAKLKFQVPMLALFKPNSSGAAPPCPGKTPTRVMAVYRSPCTG
jgi:hypothetical protein